MARPTIEELRDRRLNAMGADERVEFDEAIAAAHLALEVGEKIRDAREAAGADPARPGHAHVDESGRGCPP